MCLYASVFVSGKDRDDIIIPPTPAGLVCKIEESMQEDLSRFVNGVAGISLALHDGHCLCQYSDWRIFFDYVDRIRDENNLKAAKLLVYWSDSSYPDMDRINFDPVIDSIDTKPKEGVVYQIGIDVSKRLQSWTGNQVKMSFKDGRKIYGTVKLFSPVDGNGMLESKDGQKQTYFHEKEISDVVLEK